MAGTLTVTAHASGLDPDLESNYVGTTRSPGRASFAVDAKRTYYLRIEMPREYAPRQVDVATSLQSVTGQSAGADRRRSVSDRPAQRVLWDMKYCLAVAIAVVMSSACGSSPTAPVSQNTPTPSGPTPPVAPATSYRVTGVVMDEGGSPMAGAPVDVLAPALRFTTRTDGGGAYSVENVPGSSAFAGVAGVFALVFASAPGHWENVQLLPVGSSGDVSRHMRLRQIRRITTGDSIVLTMDAYSSLVGERPTEDFDGNVSMSWELRTIQERFIVDNVDAGRLFVNSDDGDDHSGYPFILACRIASAGCVEFYDSGLGGIDGAQRQISFNVSGGGSYEISVRVPPRPDVSRRYTIRTFRTP